MKSNKIIFLLFIISGCGASVSEFKEATLKRASYDFNCPENKIEITQLQKAPSLGENLAITYGVKGCNKQTTYEASDRMGVGNVQVNQVGSFIK
ncbi:MAG: hypothetical protein EBR02_07335 [Alphaproteobacteria bacterium]|nr:hypothetical protein [Alphaproteobacteria bacterium]